jgi:transposase
MSDHKGAALMLASLPQAKELLGDTGYDSNHFRQALTLRGIEPCIPSSRARNLPVPYDRALYRQRHRIETCSAGLRTGAASPCAVTDAPTPSCRPSAWLLLHCSGSMSPEPSITVAFFV